MRLDLAHVAANVFDTPLLISARRFESVLSALGPRILDGTSIETSKFSASLAKRHAQSGGGPRRYAGGGYYAGEGVAVLPVLGTTVRRATWLDAECGLMSYALIRQGFDAMLADPSVRAIMLELDTPGGEAGGVFDLASHMRAAAREAGKPLWAHANELAASAGYALASAADRIWVATTGEVGSIGVVAAHVDMSRADEKAGLKWTYIYEGDRKVDRNPHEPLSPKADKAIKADVRDLYNQFVDLVAKHRGVSAQRIRETEAETFRGKLAVDRKLADEVGAIETAINMLADKVGGAASTSVGESASRLAGQSRAKAEAIPAELSAHQLEAFKDVSADARSIVFATNYARQFGLEIDPAAAIARGVSPRAFRDAILTKLAARDEAVGEIGTAASAPMATKEARGVEAREAWRRALRGG